MRQSLSQPKSRRLSAGSHTVNPPFSPSTPSSAQTTTAIPLPSFFGSNHSRNNNPRRPGTSSGSAAADGLLGPGPFGNGNGNGNGPSFSDPFVDDPLPTSPRSSLRRAVPLASVAAGGGNSSSSSGGGLSEATSSIWRKKSLGRKPSLGDLPSYCTWQQQHNQTHSPPPVSRFKGFRRRRANSSSNPRADIGAALGIDAVPRQRPPQDITPPRFDKGNPPAVPPEYVLSSAPKKQSCSSSSSGSRDQNNTSPRHSSRTTSNSMESARMVSRQNTMPSSGSMGATGGMMMMPPSAMSMGMQTEAAMVHQHIQEMANKRISTLEYLRKAHEGRVYWFNTLLFDKPDLARMPYFDSRRLARRATNYLLLGLSLPTVIDINATSPLEFLRTFNLLLTEFDAFQSLHPETGSGATSALGRARIPNLNVFRRATPSAKARRSSSANNDVLYEDGDPALGGGGGGTSNGDSIGGGGGGGYDAPNSSGGGGGGGTTIMNGLGGSASVVSFGQSEADMLPGEEYVHLLTPSLPFDPDFFETFATLCDVLIDAYTRLLALLPTPRECSASVAELFSKADARVRKIIVQGVVKEFEDTSRNGVRTEVATVGKIVLGGLM